MYADESGFARNHDKKKYTGMALNKESGKNNIRGKRAAWRAGALALVAAAGVTGVLAVTSGDNFTPVDFSHFRYTYTTISSSEAMVTGYSINASTGREYDAITTNVQPTAMDNNSGIEYLVTKVAPGAFKSRNGLAGLQKLNGGLNLVEIGDEAFADLQVLVRIGMVAQPKKIGNRAFAGSGLATDPES